MRPLVLLHGMLGSGASFEALRARLPARAIYSPTLFGHGLPPAPMPRDFDDAADRLAAQIEGELGGQPVALCGYSFGARLGLALCARHPRRVHRALLISLHPGLSDPADRVARRAEDEQWAALAERGMSPLVEAWEARPIFASQRSLPESVRAAQRKTRLAHDPRAIAQAFRVLGLGAMPNLRASLHDSITLAVGADDEKFAALARRLSVTTHVIPHSGHNPIVDNLDAMVPLVRALT